LPDEGCDFSAFIVDRKGSFRALDGSAMNIVLADEAFPPERSLAKALRRTRQRRKSREQWQKPLIRQRILVGVDIIYIFMTLCSTSPIGA